MSWSETSRVTLIDGRHGFLKTHPGALDMFPAEARGMQLLASTDTVNIPDVISADEEHILLAFIETGPQCTKAMQVLGRQLARLHLVPQESCGLDFDNYIGGTRQVNSTHRGGPEKWSEFFLENRLRYQVDLAKRSGRVSDTFVGQFERAEDKIVATLTTSEPLSLLHGDLWGGNHLVDRSGQPWLIDPAVYIGHREADLAMTTLFGGFPRAFYDSYNSEYPLSDGWRKREPLYQLYHVLNHLNLFGGSYLAQAESMISALHRAGA